MITDQRLLDAALNRTHVIPVHLSTRAPLDPDNENYDRVRAIADTGLSVTTRELLHAIGCKTAALPSSSTDHCMRASLLYTYVLDLQSDTLCFVEGINSDLQTPRSQEMGIGMQCLLAEKTFGIPWDQLCSLPGPGLRFDYRGRTENLDCIFESKGTSHRDNQSSQILDGVQKKQAHHNRGECFDVELVVSTFIGRNNQQPRIVVGDPRFDSLLELYQKADDRFFRLRHYSRILQFVGLPQSAYELYQYSRAYLEGKRDIGITIMQEKEVEGYLTTVTLDEHRYFGRWYDTVFPEASRRYRNRTSFFNDIDNLFPRKPYKVFQGIREDVYRAGLNGEPFSHDLISLSEIAETMRRLEKTVSLFPDGSVQMVKINN